MAEVFREVADIGDESRCVILAKSDRGGCRTNSVEQQIRGTGSGVLEAHPPRQ